MNLDNSFETIVYYILIEWIISLSHHNWVLTVSALMCINYTLDGTYDESRLHQATILYDVSTLREYLAHDKVCRDFILWVRS